MKAPLVIVAIAAAAISAAPLASADPVPNMNQNAVAGQSCSSPTGRYIFGEDASGKSFVCGNSSQPGVWVPVTVLGIRQIGAGGCDEETRKTPGMAQSPDGVALTCVYTTNTWEVYGPKTG